MKRLTILKWQSDGSFAENVAKLKQHMMSKYGYEVTVIHANTKDKRQPVDVEIIDAPNFLKGELGVEVDPKQVGRV